MVGDIDAVILGSEKFDGDLIYAAKKLRVIARFGMGYDNIDLKATAERGIVVTYTPCKSIVISVAEHTLALMFSLAKLVTRFNKYVRNGE